MTRREYDGPVRGAVFAVLPALAGWGLLAGVVAAIWWAAS